MRVRIPNVLSPEEAAEFCRLLNGANWADGRETAGYLSQRVKDNEQLREDDPLAQRLGRKILDALDANPLFLSAALPLKVVPPLFNRYVGTQTYGRHIDGGIRPVMGTPHRVRTDLSATLFLSPPESYDGGELIIEDESAAGSVKLGAGDLLLYSGTSVHRVAPVTGGMRLASFFWIQSMVRLDAQRSILFGMDNALQALGRDVPDHPALVEMMGAYHNLLRLWSET
ncbi:MAG TPA: Fe2+-dependent dioxygenase [Rhizomicrobium sp.]|nr:Fe2+-dependent dioxygenase [Rhizomicrobium sp.]